MWLWLPSRPLTCVSWESIQRNALWICSRNPWGPGLTPPADTRNSRMACTNIPLASVLALPPLWPSMRPNAPQRAAGASAAGRATKTLSSLGRPS